MYKCTTMNYLLIEERAWMNLQAHTRRLTDMIRRLQSCRRKRLNRQHHNISKRTLQFFRNSSKLPYSTTGNKCYYKPEDVKILLDKNLMAKCG